MPKDHIEKMYTAQLESQKEQLKQDYDTADEKLIAALQKAQKATDTALTRTAVESQKAAVNNAELHDAYGLSSGARAQTRLSQENQLQADLTALRQGQLQTETDTQRQRDLLAKEYASAIRKAQAENDMAKAEALYDQAQKEEEKLLAKQEAAAQLMAGVGDYSRLAQLYGLTDAEAAALRSYYVQQSTGGSGGGDDLVVAPIDDEAGDDPGPSVPVYNVMTHQDDPAAVKFQNLISSMSAADAPVKPTLTGPSAAAPQYTDNVKKFISSHMTPQQAEANRISRSAYTAMIEQWMDEVDVELTDAEILALDKYYGLELEKRMGKA